MGGYGTTASGAKLSDGSDQECDLPFFVITGRL
jgi:hypothetical protein